MTAFRAFIVIVALFVLSGAGAAAAADYGYAARRPVMGAACPTCVWGPFAEVVKAIMAPRGYDVQICYNCNRADSPRFVANAWTPHDLTDHEKALHDPPPPKAPVDFGVTNARSLLWAYDGTYDFKADGPKRNLRLIAYFEDPSFLIVAVRRDAGITDLADIKRKRLPIRLAIDTPVDVLLAPVLDYYGIAPKDLASWGGKIVSYKEAANGGADVVISRSGSNANNQEAALWNQLSQKTDLAYLPLAEPLRQTLVRTLSYEIVDLPAGYLKGVDHAVPTVGRSGQAVYGRADMPDAFAYALAKGLDEERHRFLWTVRPFFYDPRTVTKVGDVPLHPAAARYYREVGYLK